MKLLNFHHNLDVRIIRRFQAESSVLIVFYLSGRYPIRTGLQFAMIRNDQRVGVPLDMKLLPQHLSDLGYENHAVGKWHLGYFAEE